MTEHALEQMQDYEDQCYLEDDMLDEKVPYDLIPQEPQISLGQLTFDNPTDMIEQAQKVATALKDVIDTQKLFVIINKRL